MNRYRPPRFHPFFGFAAVAMTAFTFVLAVGVPSSVAPRGHAATILAAPKPSATAGVVDVAIMPVINVIGTRDTTVAERQNKRRG